MKNWWKLWSPKKTSSYKQIRSKILRNHYFSLWKRLHPISTTSFQYWNRLHWGKKKGKTVPCHLHANCKCCKLIGNAVNEVNGRPVSSAPGTCKTKNVIYLVTCLKCLKPYIGRTIQILGKRMGGHRECFYQLLRDADVDQSKDDYSLGLHLYHEHGLRSPEDFNQHYRVQILEVCSPSQIEKKEQLYSWIQYPTP